MDHNFEQESTFGAMKNTFENFIFNIGVNTIIHEVRLNGEVNISHENTTMVVWIYVGI